MMQVLCTVKKFAYRPIWILPALFCLLVLPAQAQETKTVFPDMSLHKVTVTANREALTTENADEAKARLGRIAGGANVVSADAYEDKAARGFRDSLQFVPGVFAQERYGEEERLSIRGSGLSRGFHLRGLNILADGVPINLADNSGDFMELNQLAVSHIEVYRGANALEFGSANLGGAINLVSPVGEGGTPKFEFRAEGGSFGTWRTHGAVSGAWRQFDYYASVTGLGADGWRQQSTSSAGRFNGNFGFSPNERIETRFYLTRNDIKQEVPGTLTRTQAFNTPTRAPAINLLNDYARDITSWRVANKTSFLISDQWRLDTGGFGNLKELYHPIFQVIDQDSRDVGGFARLHGVSDFAGMTHETVFGINGRKGSIDAQRFVNIRGRRGARTAFADQNASEIDIYGQDDITLFEGVHAIVGAQYMKAKRTYVDYAVPANSDVVTYEAFNPKIGALWNVTDDIDVYANVSRSAEAPTFSELVQAPVVAFVPVNLQRAWTVEFGSRGHYRNMKWDIGFYRARINGEMLQFSVNPSFPAATFNAGRTIHQGVEAGLEIALMDNLVEGFDDALTLSQVYTFSDFRFRNDPQFGNNQIAGQPRHLYRAELEYEAKERFRIAPYVEWVPQSPYVDFANRLKADSYAVFGVSAGATLHQGVEIFVDARNLADKRYLSNYSTITDARVAATNVFYPGEARSFFGGVRLSY